jgi:precorrin-2/cobalt-factor-2 C20-methyltransferase
MDACYLTLGDTLLYSTYGYMVRALRTRLPAVEVRTIPGIPSFSAAAARVEFPLGHDKQPLCVIPVSGGMDLVRKGLQLGGVVVFMKIGRRLPELLDILRREDLLTESVFVARAGLEGERVETDLELLQSDPDAGRLSVVLVNTAKENRS